MRPTFPPASPLEALLLPDRDKAEALVRRVPGGAKLGLSHAGERLRVTDGAKLRALVARAVVGDLSALERMTLLGLLAVAEKDKAEK